MLTFALISEGQTDQVILERIIDQICSKVHKDEVEINFLRPLRDATDAAATPHGGWELVLEFCEKHAADALATNDYIVIHLDTDQGDHINFGVSLTKDGIDRSYNDLISDTIAIIVSRFDKSLYSRHAKRVLFAIAVHSTESWLLLYLFEINKIKNSLNHLNRELKKSNKNLLTKEVSAYQTVAKEINYRNLLKFSKGDNSFGLFLTKLLLIKPTDIEQISTATQGVDTKALK